MSQGTGNSNNAENNTKQHVIDFNQVRAQKLEEKRQNTQRIFFKHLLSVYTVVGDSQMSPIEFIDLHESGCSFQVPHDPINPWPQEAVDLPLRIYFSQDTFLEIRVNVQNSHPTIENNRRYVRYGCAVDTGTASYDAYLQFVKFLRSYSEHAHKDKGDVSVFYL